MTTVTPTGGSAVTATYDALGHMVENNAGGSYSEFVYGPGGTKLAKCSGQTLVKAFIGLPGGAKAIYTPTGLTYFRHSDWLGSSRLTSTSATPGAMYSSSAYAPFGEQYASAGSADASFTGKDQDTVSNLYDFPARRLSPSQGRWISPDPAGFAAVRLARPGTWNRYVYAENNPLSYIDEDGTTDDNCGDDDDCGDGGGGGGDDDDDSASNGDDDSCDIDCQLQDQQDQINNQDCLFISAGINTSATNSGGMALQGVADNYPGSQVDVAMPYGNGIIHGVLSVLSQAVLGPNSATKNFAAALANVTASNSSVTLVLFSGSAQSFNTALASGMINQNELDSIAQIVYVSPGSPGGFGNPTYSDGSPIPTATYGGSGFVDTQVTGWNSNEPAETTIARCGHSITCDLNATDSNGDPAIGELPPESNCAD